MRAKVAKRIRRLAYGAGHHLGPVEYKWGIPYAAEKSQKKSVKDRLKAGAGICLMADDSRRTYRLMKRQYLAGTLRQPT